MANRRLSRIQLEKAGTIKVITQVSELKVLVVIEIDQENPDQPRQIVSPINKPLIREISDSVQMVISAFPMIPQQQTEGSPNEVNWVLSREEYFRSGLQVGDTVILTLLKSASKGGIS